MKNSKPLPGVILQGPRFRVGRGEKEGYETGGGWEGKAGEGRLLVRG